MDPGPDLIDVHAHLGDPVFDDDREEVLERASAAGVGRVLMVGFDHTQDGFRLRKINPTGQERSQSKLPWPCPPRTGLTELVQYQLQQRIAI